MRYWGIWIAAQECWLRSGEGYIIYYPLRSIAEQYLKQMNDEWWEDQRLEVREFAEDA